MARTVGTYEQTSTAGETVNAFVPAPLPPSNPPLDMNADLARITAACRGWNFQVEARRIHGPVSRLASLFLCSQRGRGLFSDRGYAINPGGLAHVRSCREGRSPSMIAMSCRSATTSMRFIMRASRCAAKMDCHYQYGFSMRLIGVY